MRCLLAASLILGSGRCSTKMTRPACETPECKLLRNAAEKGDLEEAARLVAGRADVNGRSEYGSTALTRATSRPGNLDVVRWLVAHNADVNVAGLSTPLSNAAGAPGYNLDTVAWLVAHGASVAGDAWDTPLLGAARAGHVEVASWLVEQGADVNAATRRSTPLIAAASFRRLEMAGWLVEHRARVDVDAGGNTALMAAASREGNLQVLQLLVASGASVNQGTRDGTALTAAARASGNPGGPDRQMLGWLVDHGAAVDSSTVAAAGRTSVAHYLSEEKHREDDGAGRDHRAPPELPAPAVGRHADVCARAPRALTDTLRLAACALLVTFLSACTGFHVRPWLRPCSRQAGCGELSPARTLVDPPCTAP